MINSSVRTTPILLKIMKTYLERVRTAYLSLGFHTYTQKIWQYCAGRPWLHVSMIYINMSGKTRSRTAQSQRPISPFVKRRTPAAGSGGKLTWLTDADTTLKLLTHWGREQNGRHFADDIFKCIFLNENVWIPIEISMRFVPNGPINNIPALVQIIAWRRPGDKPLSEPMMVSLTTHIYVTRPQWVKAQYVVNIKERKDSVVIHIGYHVLEVT